MCYLLLQQDTPLQPFGSSTWKRKYPVLSFSQVSHFWSFSSTARSRKKTKKNQKTPNAVVLFNCPMITEILLWPWLKNNKKKNKSQSVNNCIKAVQFLCTMWGICLCTCYILPRSGNESFQGGLRWDISDYRGGKKDADVGISYTHAVYVGVSTDRSDGPVVPHSMNDSREQQEHPTASSS